MNPTKNIYAFATNNTLTVKQFVDIINDICIKINTSKSNYEKHIDHLVKKLQIHVNEEKDTYYNTLEIVSRLERVRVLYKSIIETKQHWKSLFMYSTIFQYEADQNVLSIIKDEFKVAVELHRVSENDNYALKTAAETLEVVLYNLYLYYNVVLYHMLGQPNVGEKINKNSYVETCSYSMVSHEKVEMFGDGYCYKATEDNSTILLSVIKRNHDLRVVKLYMYNIHQQIYNSFTYPEFYKAHQLNPEYYLPPPENMI
jgi:hypothetical protein